MILSSKEVEILIDLKVKSVCPRLNDTISFSNLSCIVLKVIVALDKCPEILLLILCRICYVIILVLDIAELPTILAEEIIISWDVDKAVAVSAVTIYVLV